MKMMFTSPGLDGGGRFSLAFLPIIHGSNSNKTTKTRTPFRSQPSLDSDGRKDERKAKHKKKEGYESK